MRESHLADFVCVRRCRRGLVFFGEARLRARIAPHFGDHNGAIRRARRRQRLPQLDLALAVRRRGVEPVDARLQSRLDCGVGLVLLRDKGAAHHNLVDAERPIAYARAHSQREGGRERERERELRGPHEARAARA